ncbi:unnamed protein product, partial [Rotaria sp. Silwood2]
QDFILYDDEKSVLAWTPSDGTNVMKEHSITCSKPNESTPQT